MQTVTVRRTIDGSEAAVRDALEDLEALTRAAGFDEVTVEGETVHVANAVGLVKLELTFEVVDDPDADLAYEQREGIFEEMRTTYAVESTGEGVAVTIRTEFALDVAFVGDFLDATVVKRQRRRELEGQLDYLEGAA